jgi:hypothetical protein
LEDQFASPVGPITRGKAVGNPGKSGRAALERFDLDGIAGFGREIFGQPVAHREVVDRHLCRLRLRVPSFRRSPGGRRNAGFHLID